VYCFESSGAVARIDVVGGRSSQRSAVGICNHLPLNPTAQRVNGGLASKLSTWAAGKSISSKRFKWVTGREGIGVFFVGTYGCEG
jgi:hypothetical protein